MASANGRASRLPLAVAAVLAIAAGWWFFLRSASATDWPVTNDPPRGGTSIVAFGDSLTRCVGASEPECYPAVLSGLIGRPIISAGREGDTTESALRRLESDVFVHDPRIVIVCLGGNNMLRRQKASEAVAPLREIVAAIQQRGAMVVLVGVEGYGILGHDDYGTEWEKVAREMGCVWVPDILGGIVGNPPLMSDPIHPNAAGYRKFAEKIYRMAGEYLQR
jgi:lysophospholipase L1-like esterase